MSKPLNVIHQSWCAIGDEMGPCNCGAVFFPPAAVIYATPEETMLTPRQIAELRQRAEGAEAISAEQQTMLEAAAAQHLGHLLRIAELERDLKQCQIDVVRAERERDEWQTNASRMATALQTMIKMVEYANQSNSILSDTCLTMMDARAALSAAPAELERESRYRELERDNALAKSAESEASLEKHKQYLETAIHQRDEARTKAAELESKLTAGEYFVGEVEIE